MLLRLTPMIHCLLSTLPAYRMLEHRPTVGQRAVALHCAASADDFPHMRRADEPMVEEVRSLQLILGGIGLVVGPRMGGSAFMGALCGVTAGAALVNAGGSTGLWAREIAWQAHQFGEGKRLPELAGNLRTTAVQASNMICTELKSLAAQPMVADARGRCVATWIKCRSWAESSSLLAPVILRVSQWLVHSKKNIERRRRAAYRS